jgi:hypothetical protein
MQTKDVQISFMSQHEVQGVVTLSASKNVQSLVRVCKVSGRNLPGGAPAGVTCSHCFGWEDTGLLCDCATGLLFAAAKNSTHGMHWSIYDPEFASPVWLTETWLQQAQVRYVLIPFDSAQQLPGSWEVGIKPWSQRPLLAGRKPKVDHGKQRSDTLRSYKCAGCGELGHSHLTCQTVNLDHLYSAWAVRFGLERPSAALAGVAKADLALFDEHTGLEGALLAQAGLLRGLSKGREAAAPAIVWEDEEGKEEVAVEEVGADFYNPEMEIDQAHVDAHPSNHFDDVQLVQLRAGQDVVTFTAGTEQARIRRVQYSKEVLCTLQVNQAYLDSV